MNHLRGFFLPAPTARGGSDRSRLKPTGAQPTTQRSGGAPRRTTPPPASERASHQRTATTTATTATTARGTGIEHLYENYRENMSRVKPTASAMHRPYMVLREYNDDFIAPSNASRARYLPREYDIVVDTDDSLSEADGGSDVLTRTHGTTLLKASSEDSDCNDRTDEEGEEGEGRSCTSSAGPDNDDGSRGGGSEVHTVQSARLPLTTSTVMELGSDGGAAGRLSGGASARRTPALTSTKAEPAARNAATEDVSSGAGASSDAATLALTAATAASDVGTAADAAPDAAHGGAEHTRRLNESSWSLIDDDGVPQGRRRRIVVAQQPASRQSEAGGAGHGPSEVEVVRLNDALFTSAELSRWRHYQVARMDGFFGPAATDAGTPSVSTRSRDVASSNSASGPEFVPMLGAGNGDSPLSGRGWVEFDAEADADGSGGLPVPKRRIVRVCCREERMHAFLPDPPTAQQKNGAPAVASGCPAPESPCASHDAAEQTPASARGPYGHEADSSSSSSSGSGSSHSSSSGSDADSRGDSVSGRSGDSAGVGSRSPSVTSLDDGAVAAEGGQAVSEGVRLPFLAKPTGEQPALHRNHRRSEKPRLERERKAEARETGDSPGAALQSLPPVGRRPKAPLFKRRLH